MKKVEIPAMSTRRGFLAGAGMALAGAAAVGLSGCAPKQLGETGETAQPIVGSVDVNWDEEYDVIAVGAGLAGCTAAVTCATEGNGATCLLIEKGSAPSGHSALSLGVSHRTDDPETFKTYIKALLGEHTTTPDDVIDTYAQGCAEHVEWIEGLGADMSTAYITNCEWNAEGFGGEYPEMPGWEAMGWFGLGVADELGKGEKLEVGPDDNNYPHLGPFMLEKCKEYADVITYRTKTALVSLVQDPSTREILGVTTDDGKVIKANKGVVMGLGGFVDNPRLMEDYLNAGAVKPASACLCDGDGIGICQKVGADFWHMSSCGMWMAPCSLDKETYTGNPHNVFSPKQYGITVGTNGRRFYMDFDGYRCGPTVTEAGGDLRVVSGYRHGRTSVGGEWRRVSFPSMAWFVFDQKGLEAGAIAESDPVENGLVYTSDTLEELAAQMGVPAEELVASIETWNRFCAEGVDRAFYRPQESLREIANPPYYAQICIPCTTNTFGGPRRGAHGEILDFEGNAIPGLYSAGEFGSIFDGLYNGGGNISECMVFGRASVRHCLNR